MTEPFRLLHVCTGNICRSPMAELLTRAGLRARLGPDDDGFEVSSAGTWGHTGSPMEPEALEVLAELDVDGAGFRARELVVEQVARADLVLAATREHRAAAVVLQPRAAARTFTLLEFARLCAGIEASDLPGTGAQERARALVAAAAARRGRVPPDLPTDDDLRDPYRGPLTQFARCAEQVRAALQPPLDLIAGAPGP